MKKTLIVLDDYGEPLQDSFERIELDESEQKEINDAIDTLKKYNAFISHEEYYQEIARANKLSSSYSKLSQIAMLSSMFGLIWFSALVYSYYSEGYIIWVFILLVYGALGYLFFITLDAGRGKL